MRRDFDPIEFWVDMAAPPTPGERIYAVGIVARGTPSAQAGVLLPWTQPEPGVRGIYGVARGCEVLRPLAEYLTICIGMCTVRMYVRVPGLALCASTLLVVASSVLAITATAAAADLTTSDQPASGVAGQRSRSTDALTRDEWLTQANNVCDDAQQEVYALESSVLHGAVFPASFPSRPFADYLTRTSKIGRRVLRDLGALKPPTSDAALVSAGLAALKETVDAITRLAKLARGDGTRYTAAVREREPEKIGRDRLRLQNYGAGSCAFLGLGPGAGE